MNRRSFKIPLPRGERLGEGFAKVVFASYVKVKRRMLIPPLAPPFKGGGFHAATLVLIACAVASADENWSRFRGPNGSGIVEGVSFPAKWTSDDYSWKVSLPGKGHSSPVAWGGRLFVTAGNDQTGELSLSAIDAATGETLWTQRFKSAPHSMHPANSYASSSPAADGRHVYITWDSPDSLQVAALTHEGDEIWRRDLGPLNYKHGFGGSPTVVDDLVIVANYK